MSGYLTLGFWCGRLHCTIANTWFLSAGTVHVPPNTIRNRFPVDQRQKAGEKSEGWKLPSSGFLRSIPLLLVNNHNWHITMMQPGYTNVQNFASNPVRIQEILESDGGLQTPAHWLPWNSNIKHSSTPQQAGPDAGPGVIWVERS